MTLHPSMFSEAELALGVLIEEPVLWARLLSAKASTQVPVKKRCQDMLAGELAQVAREQFPP